MQGLLVAWAIAIQDIWQELEAASRLEIIPVLREVFKNKRQDDRWYKGVSVMMFTYAMVSIYVLNNSKQTYT